MNKDTNIIFRVNSSLKENVSKIAKNEGVSLSKVINATLSEINKNGKIPNNLKQSSKKKTNIKRSNSKKKLVLFDMDGTVYLGDELFPFVPKVFDHLRKHNVDFVFITNNSSHSKEFYEAKMNKMGIKCDAHNFYTSVECTIKYLKDHNYKTLYVLGVESFKEKLRKDFVLVEDFDKNHPVDVVLSSFDTEVKYDELRIAALYLQCGSTFLATNMDYRCPIEGGMYIPDCGGISKLLEMASNVTPKFLGKPAPEMIYQVAEIFNVKLSEIIVCGDRYYTDIMSGINAGVDTLAVLTGETTLKEFKSAEIKPTYIKESIEALIDIIK